MWALPRSSEMLTANIAYATQSIDSVHLSDKTWGCRVDLQLVLECRADTGVSLIMDRDIINNIYIVLAT